MENVATKQTKKTTAKKVASATETPVNNNVKKLIAKDAIIKDNKKLMKECRNNIASSIKDIFIMFNDDIAKIKDKQEFKEFTKKGLVNYVLNGYSLKEFDATTKEAVKNISYYLINKLSVNLNSITPLELKKVVELYSLCKDSKRLTDYIIENPTTLKKEVAIKKGENNPFFSMCTSSGIAENKNTIGLYLKNVEKLIAIKKASILKSHLEGKKTTNKKVA